MEPIAIIGLSCHFPGIDKDIEKINDFWSLLINEQTSIKAAPKNRWDISKYSTQLQKQLRLCQKGGFLKDISLFDANYFNISPVAAKQMDPQQRLFLELAIHALNDANIRIDSLDKTATGIFGGISTQEYSQLNYKENVEFTALSPLGMASSGLSGRLSYFLNCTGPSMVVDTACSSSLTALNLAVNAIEMGQCQQAIVGGIHLNLCPDIYQGLTKAKMLSDTWQCRSFDKEANGYVRSDGGSVLIIKKLSDDLENGDKIYSVIKSIYMNQDGHTSSLASPSAQAQVEMHKQLLAKANLTAQDIDYIEAHGTGTLQGDKTEVTAINAVHQGKHTTEEPLLLGSVKSNLGHTLSTSGMASIIKAVCSFQFETIPPNINFHEPNDALAFSQIPMEVPVTQKKFKVNESKKRYIQVQNFGFTGTNLGLILEEPPKSNRVSNNETLNDIQNCFVLSAASKNSLMEMVNAHKKYLSETTESLNNICFSLLNCRDHYRYRLAIMANSKEELIDKIESEQYKIVSVKPEKKVLNVNNLDEILDNYLAGKNIILDIASDDYRKVNLPLYVFDRKSYWRKAKAKNSSSSAMKGFMHKSRIDQIAVIEQIIVDEIKTNLSKNGINKKIDFKSIGLTSEQIENLAESLQAYFDHFCSIPKKIFTTQLSIELLTKIIHQLLVPPRDIQIPAINVLNNEPIAIIGMSCRLPKANNIDDFLDLLLSGENGMIDIPQSRWDNDQYYDSDEHALGKLYIKKLGFIDHIKEFDAPFFNVSPREALFMSPQLKIILESSYHALENANLNFETIKDSNTGVFIGCGTNEYPNKMAEQGLTLEEKNIYFATGNVLNATAGRIAYTYDFQGPIQVVDTACSSSLTAVHNACLSLQSGNCDMAMAGGVNTLLTPDSNVVLSKGKMLSPTSQCHTFSDDADGYGRSEGCGLVILKRLSDAERDNDNILAVIKSTAVNSDGFSGGFTVPNAKAQEVLIHTALKKADLKPNDIDYIEAHGTGTPLADPIEMNTLSRIFGQNRKANHQLYVSSVKTNIGHCEAASGISGLIKAVLSLKAKTYFKHLNFHKLNPNIHLNNIKIPLETTPWQVQNKLRAAGVSSFGFSGANAHIILQERLENQVLIEKPTGPFLLLISAKSKIAFDNLLQQYAKYLSNTKEPFSNICYTSALGRTHHNCRTTIVAETAQQAAQIIREKEFTFFDVETSDDIPAILDKLLDCKTAYELGKSIDWQAFYKNQNKSYQKVDLPLYPFNRKTHWYEGHGKTQETVLPRNWIYKLNWQDQPIVSKSKRHSERFTLITMEPKNDFCLELNQLLQSQGLSSEVKTNDQKQFSADNIIFVPNVSSDENYYPDNIEIQCEIVKNLLNLVKAMHQACASSKLIVLSKNATAVKKDQTVNLGHACLLGFCKTIAQEYPEANLVLLDIDTYNPKFISQCLIKEAQYNHDNNHEHIIAYRDQQRFIPVLEKKPTPYQKVTNLTGRFLITGGVGGLGMVTAEALLRSGVTDLVLCSRNILSETNQRKIQTLRNQFPGRAINGIQADLAVEHQVKDLINQVNHDNGLKGIIHTAGAAIKKTLFDHTESDVDLVFKAKAIGGWYLHKYSESIQLNYFVVYSSIASVFGSKKESVYSGSNSFVDALIAERTRNHLPGLTIQWGPWGESGMAKRRGKDKNLRSSLISNSQGYEFIRTILATKQTDVTFISPGMLKFMLDFVPEPKPLFYQRIESLIDAKTSGISQQSNWLVKYQALNEQDKLVECEKLICYEIRKTLQLDEDEVIQQEKSFGDLGFDSIMLTELVEGINTQLRPNIELSSNIAFDFDNATLLSEHIVCLLQKETKALQQQSSSTSNLVTSLRSAANQQDQMDLLKTTLRIGIAEILELDEEEILTDEKPLYSVGLDSLMALEIRSYVHDQLNLPISLTIEYFINEPTIKQIAEHVFDEVKDRILPNKGTNLENDPPRQQNDLAAASSWQTVCDFQYRFWALNKVGVGFNIGSHIAIYGNLDKHLVNRAFENIVETNALFWLAFNDKLPQQKVNKKGHFKITYHDLSEKKYQQPLTNLFKKNVFLYASLEDTPLLKVYLYKIATHHHELHIVVPHIIADDLSLELIFARFKENYKKLVDGGSLSTNFNKYFIDYVNKNNKLLTDAIDAKMDFWLNYNRGVKPLFLGRQNQFQDAVKQTKFLSHYNLNYEAFDGFKTWHNKNNLNISSGLIAACQFAFTQLGAGTTIPIILLHGGREGQESQQAMGLYSEYKRINLTTDPDAIFMDAIKQVEKQLLKTAPFQKCSNFIKDLGLDGNELSLMQKLHYQVNRKSYKAIEESNDIPNKLSKLYVNALVKLESLFKGISLRKSLKGNLFPQIPIQPAEPLRVIITITPSFFIRNFPENKFADLTYEYPSHYACMDRSIGNKTLWIYFSINHLGNYQVSINGPITDECQQKLVESINYILQHHNQFHIETVQQLLEKY